MYTVFGTLSGITEDQMQAIAMDCIRKDVMNTPHIKYCLCSSCWFTLARSALEPQELAERAKRYRLTQEQYEKIDELVEREKLENWNSMTKGEKGANRL